MTSAVMTVSIPNPAQAMRELRDIRSDLRERIAAIEALLKDEIERFQRQQEKASAEHKRQTDAFTDALRGYQRMLDLEETLADANVIGSNNKVGPMPAEIKMPASRLPLADFLVVQLTENGPMSKDELRLAAKNAGYFPESDGGRAVHATLINIARNNRVCVDATGKYTANTLQGAFM